MEYYIECYAMVVVVVAAAAVGVGSFWFTFVLVHYYCCHSTVEMAR